MNQNVRELSVEVPASAPAVPSRTRPLYWSIRRELWENRSLHLVPLIVAVVSLFGFLVSMSRTLRHLRGVTALDAAKQHDVVTMPYSVVASMILFSGFIVGIFYCLDAMNGERRDRSLLFWKSLPVSDRTAVLAKALVPVAVLPLLTFAIALVTQIAMLLFSSAALLATGLGPMTLWSRLPMFEMTLVMFYGLAAHALWFAPIYGWLLLVSAWARRLTFVWAVIPLFIPFAIEKIVSGTSRFAGLLRYRLIGGMTEAFVPCPPGTPINRLAQVDPLGFVSSPGLWTGLLFAAGCLALAIRLRRNRDPV